MLDQSFKLCNLGWLASISRAILYLAARSTNNWIGSCSGTVSHCSGQFGLKEIKFVALSFVGSCKR